MALTVPLRRPPEWTTFDVSDGDLEFIVNTLMEREIPLTTREMALALLVERLERARREEARAAEVQEAAYRPAEAYVVGARLLFPAMGGARGQVVEVRPGSNPAFEPFDVIGVAMEPDGARREFAARLAGHALNEVPPAEAQPAWRTDPEAVFERHGPAIEARLHERLARESEIVRIAGRWFPRALIADIHSGHLNLAEAVLDVAEGGPLPTTSLLEHVELPPSVDPLLAAFSLDYAMQEDERFDEVGPAGQVLWFLRRLEPPEVLYAPPRLVLNDPAHDRARLTPELQRLEGALDDEFGPAPEPGPAAGDVDEAVVPLLFPHWRVGTLPLSSTLQPFFPTAYESPRIRFILVDGHSGETFPCWVARSERYVTGLEAWYRKYEVPAGGLVRVRRGQAQGEVVVEAVDRRRRNDWIRTVSIGDSGQIGFSMLKQPVGCAYDDRMIVGLADAVALDEAWLRGEQRRLNVERLVAHVFRELAKLNPQSAVHAQSLYSGVNVLRRMSPGPIFAELVSRPYYAHVGDDYWRLDDTASPEGGA